MMEHQLVSPIRHIRAEPARFPFHGGRTVAVSVLMIDDEAVQSFGGSAWQEPAVVNGGRWGKSVILRCGTKMDVFNARKISIRRPPSPILAGESLLGEQAACGVVLAGDKIECQLAVTSLSEETDRLVLTAAGKAVIGENLVTSVFDSQTGASFGITAESKFNFVVTIRDGSREPRRRKEFHGVTIRLASLLHVEPTGQVGPCSYRRIPGPPPHVGGYSFHRHRRQQ